MIDSIQNAVLTSVKSLTKTVLRSLDGLYNISLGMFTVAKHVRRDPITEGYPHQMPELYPSSRHRLALNVNPDTGEHLCIACKQCERVCPDNCITVIPNTDVKAKSSQFYLDHGLCMFCGLCTEVCPTNCIINTVDFEMSSETREDLIYDIKKLTLSPEQSRSYFDMKDIPLPKPKVKPAPKPAAAVAGAGNKDAVALPKK